MHKAGGAGSTAVSQWKFDWLCFVLDFVVLLVAAVVAFSSALATEPDFHFKCFMELFNQHFFSFCILIRFLKMQIAGILGFVFAYKVTIYEFSLKDLTQSDYAIIVKWKRQVFRILPRQHRCTIKIDR